MARTTFGGIESLPLMGSMLEKPPLKDDHIYKNRWWQMADIKSTFQAIGFIAVVLLVLLFFLAPLFWVALTYGDNYEWIFTRRIPLTEDASNVQVNFPSMGGTRSTTFETTLPPEAVVDFYHNVLPKRGFRFVCGAGQLETPIQDCPEWIATNPPFLEYFIKGDVNDRIVVVIFIREQEAAEGRHVAISEQVIQYSLNKSTLVAVTPAPAKVVMTPGAYPWPGAATPTPLPSYP
jgi:ABC-type glycerol-3-phosphate transport system permease component